LDQIYSVIVEDYEGLFFKHSLHFSTLHHTGCECFCLLAAEMFDDLKYCRSSFFPVFINYRLNYVVGTEVKNVEK